MNRPIWADDQAKVLAVHPTAYCMFNPLCDKFFIRIPLNGVKGDIKSIEELEMVSLSSWWETETMAWHDAAANVRRHEEINDDANGEK